jgi:hypothetical protein
MKIKLLISLIILFFPNYIIPAQTITKSEIIQLLPSIFKTKEYKTPDYNYVSEDIDSLPSENVYSDLTNINMLYLDYIRVNYASISSDTIKYAELNRLNSNLDERNKFYINQLISDSVFCKYFLELSYYYFNSKRIIITDYKPEPKLRLTSNEITAIASKFFYASDIRDDSLIVWHICVGINGYANDKKKNMMPLVEGFCLMVIMNNMEDTVIDFNSDFDKNAESIQKDYSGISDPQLKLEKVRQKMFDAMSKSENLKKYC